MTQNFSHVHQLMEQATRRVFPCAVLRVSRGNEILYHEAHGRGRADHLGQPITVSAVFDVASVSKAMAVGTLAMIGVEKGWMDLDAPVADMLPAFRRKETASIRVSHLLSHRSGLPDWRPYLDWLFERHPQLEPGTPEAIKWIKRWIFREPLIAEPDQRETYSDLGFMILGWWLEACHGKGLDTLFQEIVATPMGLENTEFIPISTWESIGARFDSPQIATTEICPGRRRLIHGEVHDENAFFLGGVAGHAGLFSTAEDVGKWADTLLACSKKDGFISTSVIQRFWHPTFPQEHGTWRLSWDGPTPEMSSGGEKISDSAVCHLGFTGCSVWIDPERNMTVVLLSNRVHPRRDNESIRDFRPLLHDAIWAEVDGD